MPEMSRGEMMRGLDKAAKDALKRLASGPLTDGQPHALARTLAGLVPSEADNAEDSEAVQPSTNIVGHLDQSPVEPESSATPEPTDL
jgi:hypothetical protein